MANSSQAIYNTEYGELLKMTFIILSQNTFIIQSLYLEKWTFTSTYKLFKPNNAFCVILEQISVCNQTSHDLLFPSAPAGGGAGRGADLCMSDYRAIIAHPDRCSTFLAHFGCPLPHRVCHWHCGR